MRRDTHSCVALPLNVRNTCEVGHRDSPAWHARLVHPAGQKQQDIGSLGQSDERQGQYCVGLGMHILLESCKMDVGVCIS